MGRRSSVPLVIAGVMLASFLAAPAAVAHPEPKGSRLPSMASSRFSYVREHMPLFRAARGHGEPSAMRSMSATGCVDGHAGSYPCRNIDLAAFLPLAQIGGGAGNDIWGWTDPLTGSEYALMGRSNGTAFVDITMPESPVYLGNLPSHTVNSDWRDLEVVNDHAVIVSEAVGHGMQIFDLTQLPNVANPPETFQETGHYGQFGSAHTVTANPESGFVYANGSNTCGGGGAHIVDMRDPDNPSFAGCYSADGYTHDSQCVIYRGPDVAHRGQEICFESNEDTITIVNMTNKSSPQQISRTSYPGVGYTHQGWLTEDHRFFILDDEQDETRFGHNTRTRVFGMRNLEAPVLRYVYDATTPAIDHQQFVRGNFIYQSNYRAGLHILSGIGEVGFFDIYPANDRPFFNGTWANYPFYESGVVVVSGIEQGLFVLRPHLPANSLTLAW
jgi:choice-of-anchor B domain-containing protein